MDNLVPRAFVWLGYAAGMIVGIGSTLCVVAFANHVSIVWN